MRNLVILTAAFAFVLAVFYLFALWPNQDSHSPVRRAIPDLPWQVRIQPEGTSRVLGIEVGADPLRRAVERYGDPEGLSLFVSPEGSRSLEAYFGTVRLGLLKGELIATLEAPESVLAGLQSGALDRKGTRSGAYRYVLRSEDKEAQLGRTIRALTYIPAYAGMDEAFLRERFGEPAEEQRIDDTAVRWLYPEKGVTLLIDAEGSEVFQYVAPGEYSTPAPPPR